MIELYVFAKPKNKKIYNYSPFCGKTEAFLQLAELPHSVKIFNGNPAKFPKSKLPAIKYKDQVLGDSSFIQAYLESEFQLNIDAHLNESEKAQGFAFQKMTEEFLYWVILHQRWILDTNWRHTRDRLFASVPSLVRPAVGGLVRRGIKKAAYGHGIARHSDKDVLALGDQCVRSLSHFLADKPFFLGDQISSFDTSLWAALSNVLFSDLSPQLQALGAAYPNIGPYCDRVWNRLQQQQNNNLTVF